MKYRCVCPGAMPYTASGTWLWTASPAAQSALSSYEFYLREALCGKWITEMKRLKTQLDFHSSWEVINIWISCHWELISFSSGQVLLRVPATVCVSPVWLGCCSEYGRYVAELEELCVERACAVDWGTYSWFWITSSFSGAWPQLCAGCGILICMQPLWSSWLHACGTALA